MTFNEFFEGYQKEKNDYAFKNIASDIRERALEWTHSHKHRSKEGDTQAFASEKKNSGVCHV